MCFLKKVLENYYRKVLKMNRNIKFITYNITLNNDYKICTVLCNTMDILIIKYNSKEEENYKIRFKKFIKLNDKLDVIYHRFVNINKHNIYIYMNKNQRNNYWYSFCIKLSCRQITKNVITKFSI